MIRLLPNGNVNVGVNGRFVYLDNWAIYDLAERDRALRRRFIDAIGAGIDLLFSVTNAAELSGPQGRSAQAVAKFLDRIGPRWFPARLDTTEVIKQEMNGVSSIDACLDRDFFRTYIGSQMQTSASGRTLRPQISEDHFLLGKSLGMVGNQRSSIKESSREFDELIKTKMTQARHIYKRTPALFEQKLPWISYNPSCPAFFAYRNLLRVMAIEADSLKKGDGMDFCHAVIACTFSSFAALDTHWKRRIEKLPAHPRGNIYTRSELGQMVTDMEAWVRRR